ncbi:hypothetical protein [Qipengyuania vesicularis]|uniref:hypothetical protein n=1 Tax=Qipengyuania vesicularis TaxID=2867232 RepID=UPI001C876CA1|nr:hypothetical protein [Qipengyuania vesicularis]MBX7526415.1 hypothetical protein [Qipengyuania vesicularis]
MKFHTTMAALALHAAASVPAVAEDSPDFGDDSSEYARDGECDDVRFVGEGMAEALLTDNIGKDATDCSAAFKAGSIERNPLFADPATNGVYDFGDNTSSFAYDGICDDIRFVGPHSPETLYLAEDIGHDASDCREGVEAGELTWQANAAEIEMGLTVGD